jgi:phosphate-selective porin OprO/OprP
MASWVLTGESRPYNAGAWPTSSRRTTARWNWWPVTAAWTGRWQHPGGRQHDLTLGANWYLTSHFKFQANYVKVDASRRGVHSTPEIFELRAQMHFCPFRQIPAGVHATPPALRRLPPCTGSAATGCCC